MKLSEFIVEAVGRLSQPLALGVPAVASCAHSMASGQCGMGYGCSGGGGQCGMGYGCGGTGNLDGSGYGQCGMGYGCSGGGGQCGMGFGCSGGDW